MSIEPRLERSKEQKVLKYDFKFQQFTAEPKEYDDKTGCSAVASKCKFPFKFNDKEYNECTNDVIFEDEDNLKTKEDFHWCATSVNNDRRMKKGKWGICDPRTCDL